MSAAPLHEKNFEREVLHRRGAVLVAFHGPNCAPCKTLAPTVDALVRKHPDLRVASVDSQKNPKLAQRYQILTLPTLLLFRRGRLSARAVGAKTISALEEMIK